MGNNDANIKKKTWTPELIIQAFKEIITAVLGIIVVAYTIYFALNTLNYIGKEPYMTDAKDVLMLMLGIAGVVIGYYFGRIPGDARAAQAQENANEATAKTEKVNAQVQIAANKVEQIIEKMPVVGTRGGGDVQTDLLLSENLQQIRDELRSLHNISQTLK